MEKLINFLKASGFVYQGSDIYGGLANSWDYGPLGVQFKNKLKALWWEKFVSRNKYNVGVDSSIILNNRVWQASGHLTNFNDPLIDCKECKSRFRADKLLEENYNVDSGGWPIKQLEEYIEKNKIKCPKCNNHNFTKIRQFTLMFKTNQGVFENENSVVYLRPETAQGIFINFKNIQRTTRKKIPFGVGQIGKAFRNEITPGNFIFRTREFEQMELEFFISPHDDFDWFEYWLSFINDFLTTDLQIKKEHLIQKEHPKEKLSHYSKKTVDFEYKFPFGTSELWGIAHRGSFDLTQHQNLSGQDLTYLDPKTNEKYVPEVVEPSVGVERLMLAILIDSYFEDKLENGEIRQVLKLPKNLAPYKVAVLPLQKQQSEFAAKLYENLIEKYDVIYDESGQIGKRYRRQDAIGTPYCLTVDFDSAVDNKVTIRDRDTMTQQRVLISELDKFLK